MTCYSVQPRDWIFVKGYGFLSFAKNMGKHIDKNISKNLSSKYSQNILIMLKNLLIKRHHRIIQKQMKKKYLEKDIYLQN